MLLRTELMQQLQHSHSPSEGHTNLNGKWRGVWHSKRPRYPAHNDRVTPQRGRSKHKW